jgi:hypothetical protein
VSVHPTNPKTIFEWLNQSLLSRFQKILTMTLGITGVSGLCPSSGILKEKQRTQSFRSSGEDGNRFSFRNAVFSIFNSIGRWTKSKNRVIPTVMKLGMYNMATEPIITAYFINPSHQSVCLCVYPPIVARQRLGKKKSYRGNEYACKSIIVRRVVFYAVPVVSKETLKLVLSKTSC